MKTQGLRVVVVFVIAAGLLAPAGTSAAGSICYVDHSAGGANSGTSWTNAYTDLHWALSNGACGEIWVAQGVYVTGAATTSVFGIPPGKRVYGGFEGDETLRSERDPWSHLTILSGDIDHNDTDLDGNKIAESFLDVQGTNSARVTSMAGATAATVLDGFTITAGSGTWGGAGLFCDAYQSMCNPTLANLVFSGNYATGGGGALYLNAGGGGVSRPLLTNVTFRGNKAPYGGAIYILTGAGGIGSPTFMNVTFVGNEAVNHAGALYNDGRQSTSSPILKNVTFQGNKAGGEGGALLNLSCNTVSDGGISQPVLTNVTFQGNVAAHGGAIYNSGTCGTLKPRLTNVIVWDNQSEDGYQIYNDAAAHPSMRYSVVEGGDLASNTGTAFSDGAGNTSADPRLTELDDHGGPTETMLLLAGSSAVNKGNDTACPSKDQRGIKRPQGPHCDIGATEAQYASFRSQGSKDGWVLESGEATGLGGSANSSSTTLRLGDDAENRQYKSVLSFNTAGLADAAQVTSAGVKVRHAGIAGDDPFASFGVIKVDCAHGYLGTSASLEPGDFEADPTYTSVLAFTSPPAGGWYPGDLGASYLDCINQDGPTQFRMRFGSLDDNDDETADYLKLYSGESVTSKRPQLAVYYYFP